MHILVILIAMLTASVLRAEESAPYSAIKTSGAFEIRDYPALVLVETATTGNEGNNSFGKLFRFISGANDAEQKIPMTTPVFMDARGTPGRMSFVMPAAMPLAQTPRAKDPAVAVREQPAGRYAVYRFSGSTNADAERKALAKLDTWMATEGLRAAGKPFYAYYNPPWTLPFLRRNEVMVPVVID